MKLSANEMLFVNSAEAHRMRAHQIISNGGKPEELARALKAAGDFYRQAGDLVERRTTEK